MATEDAAVPLDGLEPTGPVAHPNYNVRGVLEVPPEGLTRASLAKGLLWLFSVTIGVGLVIFAFSSILGLQTDAVTSAVRDILAVEAPVVTMGIAFYLGSDARHRG